MAVLGRFGSYPRFGFAHSARIGIKCEFDLPEDVFMILELKPEYLAGKTDTTRNHVAFGELETR